MPQQLKYDKWIPAPHEINPCGFRLKKLMPGLVLVRREDPTKVTTGGILLPGDGEASTFGRVVQVAECHLNRRTGDKSPMQVKEGDRVIVGATGGHPVPIYKKDGGYEILYILREGDYEHTNEILAVVDE